MISGLRSFIRSIIEERLVFQSADIGGGNSQQFKLKIEIAIEIYLTNSPTFTPRALATLWTVKSDGFLLPRSKPLIYDL